jgi:hypothetical protein
MNKISKTLLAAFAVAGLITSAVGGPAVAAERSAPLKGEGEGMELIANIEYQGGTDMEFRTIKGRDYAFTGASPNYSGGTPAGFRVIDVTTPKKPKVVGHLPCAVNQADIQISHDNKTAIMAADSAGGPESCLAVGKLGFLLIDISNVKKPKAVGFAEIRRGSHNTTAHPKKPFVYNSDSDLAGAGQIEIWSIKNPKAPEKVNALALVGHSPHDISFNKDGTRAVTAAISHVDLINTEDPENPKIISVTQCPGCSITHDAKFTPDGKNVIVGDEGGGGGGYPCPGGALYFGEIVGGTAIAWKGVYEPDHFVTARNGQGGVGACTSHVFDISPDGKRLAISWYTVGTRYLDIETPSGFAVGSNGTGGVKELGWFMPEGGVSWSSKIFKGHVYSNDMKRGFDVYKPENK